MDEFQDRTSAPIWNRKCMVGVLSFMVHISMLIPAMASNLLREGGDNTLAGEFTSFV